MNRSCPSPGQADGQAARRLTKAVDSQPGCLQEPYREREEGINSYLPTYICSVERARDTHVCKYTIYRAHTQTCTCTCSAIQTRTTHTHTKGLGRGLMGYY